MNIPVVDYKRNDLERSIIELRNRLMRDSDVISRSSSDKTVEVFGKPLAARQVVAKIIEDVRSEGDAAVSHYTYKLDRVSLTPAEFRVPEGEIESSLAAISENLERSLRLAEQRIRHFQTELLKQSGGVKVESGGITSEVRYRPLKRVGVYVPGGAASYPSSVLMGAIPARVAGVEEVVICSPGNSEGRLSPSVLAAASIAGVNEVYRLGGAQAVAAMALGTPTIPRVEKIVGPGNLFVAEAKNQLFGEVGIDLIAGPSEILIIADSTAKPHYVAADMLSQAEHDPGVSVLLSDSPDLIHQVLKALEHQLAELPRAEASRSALERFGLIAQARDLKQAAELADLFAPEHLEINTADPDELAEMISNAGAIFLGPDTPEGVGDYMAGPSHVLPTAGAARFMSGLSARDFMKGVSLISCSRFGLESTADDIVRIAEAEGLEAHAASILVRFEAKRNRR